MGMVGEGAEHLMGDEGGKEGGKKGRERERLPPLIPLGPQRMG